ncbi:MAG: hypothetical protein H0U98_06655 [Alphaproteobacteria bacterium]|nr:hypothetical protein [Alphaproteobacteria bacterium]
MNSSQAHLVPGRACGGCTSCCKDLTIDAPDLKKAPGILCPHCVVGKGCGIYLSRPSVCDGFYCGWRQMPLLDDGWRPDRAQILITTASKHIPAGYPPQGLTFELTGSLERVTWPPFLNLVCDLVEDGVPVFLSVRGEPGHVSANIFLNDRLRPAILARDAQGVMENVRAALQACLDHPKEKVAFDQP